MRRLVLLAVVGLLWAGLAGDHAAARPGGPDVVGMSLREAVAELESWDPDVRVAVVPDPLPVDLDWGEATVVDQVDVAVEGGTEIELRARAVVPHVTGMDTSDAFDVLVSRGLFANAKVYGTVSGQSIDAGAVEPFGVVLWLDVVIEGVSTAPPRVDTVDVPEVTGRSLVDARAILLEAGLTPSERVRGFGEPGFVVDQEPPAGTTVALDTVVATIAEASAPPPRPLVVPDVVGWSVEEASSTLEDAGLAVDLRIDSPVPWDEPSAVVAQAPEPGTEVDEGTVVALFADAMVYVPDLDGMDEDGVRAALDERGLDLAFEVASEGDDPRVREQSPSPGELVVVGSEVWALAVPAGGGPSELVTPTSGDGGGGEGGDVEGGDVEGQGAPWAWVAMGAAVSVVVLLVAVVARLLRRAARRRQVRRLRQHVQVLAVDVPCVTVVDEASGPDRSHSVRLVPHDVPPTQTIEEEVRR